MEKSKLDIRETAPRSTAEYETDMNIRLQRDRQRAAVCKLVDLRSDWVDILPSIRDAFASREMSDLRLLICSGQDVQVGEAVSYLLDKLKISHSDPTSRQPTPASRTRTPASARTRVATNKREERTAPRGQTSGGEERPADDGPRWQVAVDKPRFI